MATIQRSLQESTGERSGGRPLSSEILDRLPPQNLEAEKGVLGSLLLDPNLCDDVALILGPEDFYAVANQVLYGHLLAMHETGVRIDSTLLHERLSTQGHLESIGGVAYLLDVAQSVPVAANAVYYARIVREKATLRALIHSSTEILRDAYDQSIEPGELLNRAEERVFRILENQGLAESVHIHDVLMESLSRIDARVTHGASSATVHTGYTDLDVLTGGLNDSELIILAARPSMGKTALAINIADFVTVKERKTTLFVSLEMSRLELAERLLCSHGRIDSHRLRNGTISQTDRKRLVEASSTISQAPLFIDDSPSRTMTEIAATARRLKRRQNLALVVIDYLQLIEPDNLKDPRQEQVARIARRLKGLARELKIPVLCLAQLNRQAEMSRENRPKLSHLRESGAIEQDADVVMFVHRDEYYATGDEKEQFAGQADIIISKQRNGPIGDIKLHWFQQFTRFENRDPHHDESEQFRPY